MRQVMPMASGLASGLALSSFGIVSALLTWGLMGAGRQAGHFARGAFVDRETARFDPMTRKAGYALIGLRKPRQTRPRENSISSWRGQ
jgi:type IV secretion system protein VirB6